MPGAMKVYARTPAAIANRGSWNVTAMVRDGQSNVTPRPGDVTTDLEDAARVSPVQGPTGGIPGGRGPRSTYGRAGAGGRRGCSPGQDDVASGRSVNASTWAGRTTVKCRLSKVAMRWIPRRSAMAMTDASVPPRRRSA